MFPASSPGVQSVLVIHGGNWNSENHFLSKGEEAPRQERCEELQAQGFAVFDINYPLAGGAGSGKLAFPTQVEAAKRAIEWIEANAASFNGSATRLCILGASTGGNIALLTADAINHKAGSQKIKAVVTLSAVTDLVEIVKKGGLESQTANALGTTVAEILTNGSAGQKLAEQWSPTHNVHGVTAAFHQLFGSKKETVVTPDQQVFEQTALEAAGVSVERWEPDTAEHAFKCWKVVVGGLTVYAHITKYIQEHV